jgi:hypothetical protein
MFTFFKKQKSYFEEDEIDKKYKEKRLKKN